MSKAVKAALLSALLFPGAGHLYLKLYRRATVLMVIGLVSFTTLVIAASLQALELLEQITAQYGNITTDQLLDLAAQASTSSDSTTLSIASWVFVATWLIGLIDAYRSGGR